MNQAPPCPADQKNPKLKVQNLCKHFPYRGEWLTVLQDIQLHLHANEFVGLVGASGCGKSTLLKIIAGLMPPSSGEIWLNHKLVRQPGADRGLVFQNDTLFPWLTVADNIGYGMSRRGVPKAERKQRISYYLEVIGLTPFALAYPKQLSGGMKQRVAIARALANEPEVLLMDEPFGALDAQTKEQMQEFLRDLWQATQTTILLVTHDLDEAIFLSQRIYVMTSHPGCIKAEIPMMLPEHRDLAIKLDSSFIAIKRQVINAL